jgi:hypothetical protein
MRVLMGAGSHFEIERDPALLAAPERMRDWPGWLASIVGYEYRKAAERPRYREVYNNRGFAMITGLTS